MKQLKLFPLFACMLAFVTFSSCGDDEGDDIDCDALELEFSNAAEAVGEALGMLLVDQSTENCNALKAAYQELVDLGQDAADCVPEEDRAQFEADLREAEAQLADLDCSS